MIKQTLALIGLTLSITLSNGANATLLDFAFESGNSSGTGLLTGVIRGLANDASNQQALSFEIFTDPTGLSLGEWVPSTTTWSNSFSVAAGILTAGSFSAGRRLSDSEFTNINLQSIEPISNAMNVHNQDGRHQYEGDFAVTGVTPSEIPIPATLALFGLGLVGLGWSRRKKA